MSKKCMCWCFIHYASKCLRCAKYSARTSAYSFSWTLLQFSVLSTVYTTETIRTVHVDVHRRHAPVVIPAIHWTWRQRETSLHPTTRFELCTLNGRGNTTYYKGIRLFKHKTFLLAHRLQILTKVFKITVDLVRKLITQTNDLSPTAGKQSA